MLYEVITIAVEAMKAGAYDYLTKPLALEKLKLVLDKAVFEERRDNVLSYYQGREASDSGLTKLIGSWSDLDLWNALHP